MTQNALIPFNNWPVLSTEPGLHLLVDLVERASTVGRKSSYILLTFDELSTTLRDFCGKLVESVLLTCF